MNRLTFTLILFFGFIYTVFSQTIELVDYSILHQDEYDYLMTVDVTIPEGLYQGEDRQFFNISSPENSPWLIKNIVYPSTNTVKHGIPYYEGTISLEVELRYIPSDTSSETNSVNLNYQLCTDKGICYFPKGYEIAIDINPTIDTGSNNLLYYFLLAFIGGLILNLMPCVFPLLTIRVLSFVKTKDAKPLERVFQASLYGIGIVITFILLALIIILLKNTGQLVGWGFQFQNPWFVFFLSLGIFIFSLSLFDMYHWDFSLMSKPLQKKTSGRWGSFFSGIFAVIVATPCTAPFMGTALAFAFTQSTLIILGIFIFMGIGMMLPYLLLSFFPQLVNKLPKSGAWMDIFKNIMGFMLLGVSLYLLNTLIYLIEPNQFIKSLFFIFIIYMEMWIGKRIFTPKHKGRTKIITFIFLLIITIGSAGTLLNFHTLNDQTTDVELSLRPGWKVFSEKEFDRLRQMDTPVFVDFYAQWCTNCKFNELAVFNTERADNLFKVLGIQPMKGDFTKYDPVIAKWLNQWGKIGLPAYGLYVPGQDEPILLPEILTFDNFEDILRKGMKL